MNFGTRSVKEVLILKGGTPDKGHRVPAVGEIFMKKTLSYEQKKEATLWG